MNSFLSQNIIWNILEKRNVKICAIVGILLFYIIYNIETPFFELLLSLFIVMSLGICVSGIILYGWLNLEQKKDPFLNKAEILNIDYFIRIYILYYVIMIPIGMLF